MVRLALSVSLALVAGTITLACWLIIDLFDLELPG